VSDSAPQLERSASVPLWLRIVRSPLIRLLLGFIWIVLVTAGFQKLLSALPGVHSPGTNPGLAALLALISLLAYAGFVRLLERRPVTELSKRGAAAEAGLGVLLGAGLFSATIGILAMAGAFHVHGSNPASVMLPVLADSIAAGVIEELLMRALVFRLLEELLGTWLALAISAVLFGALHLANPHSSLLAGIALVFEAGVILAAAYVATRRLWLAIGLHFSWNFTQGGIFGVAVSGNTMSGLLRGQLSGPSWLSGGAFGAESSLVAVLLCFAAGVALLALGRKRGHMIAAPWHRRAVPGAAASGLPA
jgi:membrane protease YdiL (CAAX protease family)